MKHQPSKEQVTQESDEFSKLLEKPHICNLKLQSTEQSVGLLTKLLQRVNPVGIKARVRFDKYVGKWAILNEANKPIQHFDSAVMENVTMESVEVKEYVGCGVGTETTRIGVANGTLYLHKSASSLVGAKNLSFKSGSFVDSDQNKIGTASKVALMPERKAIYWD